MRHLIKLLVLLTFSAFSLLCFATQTVEVIGGNIKKIPIAVASFDVSAEASDPTGIIKADLTRSGLFNTLDISGIQPTIKNEVNYPALVSLQAQALVVGAVAALPGQQIRVTFELLDVPNHRSITALEFDAHPSQLAAVAHKISDIIYQKLTGERGVFSTKMVFVAKRRDYQLCIADADGGNIQPIVSSPEPVISPTWSPDGSKIAYVSFESKKPAIYVQSLTDGKRQLIANFSGNNSSPAWAPDGKRLAIVLTYAANSQIYLINSDGSGLKKISSSTSIDTEPTWSPDGQFIYFTSDRSGSPQIYRMTTDGSQVKRITFQGDYNVSAKISPNGQLMTFIHRFEGKYMVAQIGLDRPGMTIISNSTDNESPSYSANGRYILFASKESKKSQLSIVMSSSNFRSNLFPGRAMEIRDPEWGPFNTP